MPVNTLGTRYRQPQKPRPGRMPRPGQVPRAGQIPRPGQIELPGQVPRTPQIPRPGSLESPLSKIVGRDIDPKMILGPPEPPGGPAMRLLTGQNLYAQMATGRGYQEPISPEGVGAYLRNQFLGRRAAEAAATPPILASPQAEAIAAQIMGQERAKFAQQNRWKQMAAENLGQVQSTTGAWERAGLPYAPAGVGTLDVAGRPSGPLDALGRVTTTSPTILPPRPAPSTVETPEERAARIEAQFVDPTGGHLATQFNRPAQAEGNRLAEYLREVVNAQAGRGTMPAPFRGQMPDQQIAGLGQALARPEGQVKITPEARKAKRQTELDIRSRIAEGNRVGRPLTRQQAQMMAQLEGKVLKGEPLSAMETISSMTPEQQARLGPEGIAAVLESAPERLQVAERTALVQAVTTAIGQMGGKGQAIPERLWKSLDALVAQTGKKGIDITGRARGLQAEGGGLPAEEQRTQMKEAQGTTPPTDPVAWERLQQSQPNPASDEEIDRLGRQLFGDYAWRWRHWGYLHPKSVIPTGVGGLIPEQFFSTRGRQQMGIRLPGD